MEPSNERGADYPSSTQSRTCSTRKTGKHDVRNSSKRRRLNSRIGELQNKNSNSNSGTMMELFMMQMMADQTKAEQSHMQRQEEMKQKERISKKKRRKRSDCAKLSLLKT